MLVPGMGFDSLTLRQPHHTLGHVCPPTTTSCMLPDAICGKGIITENSGRFDVPGGNRKITPDVLFRFPTFRASTGPSGRRTGLPRCESAAPVSLLIASGTFPPS